MSATPEMKAVWHQWWAANGANKQFSPEHNANATRDIFYAGYKAGLAHAAKVFAFAGVELDESKVSEAFADIRRGGQ